MSWPTKSDWQTPRSRPWQSCWRGLFRLSYSVGPYRNPVPQMLEVKNLTVILDGKSIVADISLRLEQGSIGCLLGPSGCGKTTLLRAVAGFVQPRRGEVRINGLPRRR